MYSANNIHWVIILHVQSDMGATHRLEIAIVLCIILLNDRLTPTDMPYTEFSLGYVFKKEGNTVEIDGSCLKSAGDLSMLYKFGKCSMRLRRTAVHVALP